MIHFFKPKSFLRDFIPDNHIDIHSHLLPNIDDGATSINNSAQLILGLKEIGISRFITTPHIMGEVWKNSRANIKEKEKSTVIELDVIINANNFRAAAEYMMDAEFHILLKKEPLLTITDNYLLVEMSYFNPPAQLYKIIADIKELGYEPILAHPERYNFYHNSIDEYRKLKKAGCHFQLNMLSATGYYGERISKEADVLIKEGLIDFIGSDVHHERHLASMHKKIVLKNSNSLYSIFQNNSIFKV